MLTTRDRNNIIKIKSYNRINKSMHTLRNSARRFMVYNINTTSCR